MTASAAQHSQSSSSMLRFSPYQRVEEYHNSLHRPMRQAARRTRELGLTSRLFEGGALDSQITDSQFVRELLTCEKQQEHCHVDPAPERDVSPLESQQQSNKDVDLDATCVAWPDQLSDDGPCENKDSDTTGPGVEDSRTVAPQATLPSPSASDSAWHSNISLRHLLQLLTPAERAILREIGIALVQSRQEIEQQQAQESAILSSRCRSLEYRISQLEGALQYAGVESPIEESSQFV
ncbi:hypothetical protein OH76DRAFT_1559688 [Lentinus brumalis]|uniref:Uncharacterized protein n=1 Tax=Lentinus brumalis TaxID=2498619 RepID=A0A371CW25_9APHY|nr:hypothetical protein OH76DRAFT_1559688 [Polyporus brumalis]